MKIAVITDNGKVQRFALNAIDAIRGADEIHVFSCENTSYRRNLRRHILYYLLNTVTVRNHMTRLVPISSGTKRIASQVSFLCEYEGSWQKLPAEIVKALRDGCFDVILKFGMGLLRLPEDQELTIPILSYHHGDPDRYRGRPAGFWEIVEGTPVLGQMVQQISNKLDAGKVLAFAETKVMPWSYRATLTEAFRISPLIINSAIENAISGRVLEKPCTGRNYRLPSNWQVLRFTIAMAGRFAKRLGYGGFVEKGWRVSTTTIGSTKLLSLAEGESLPPVECWRHVPISKGFTFYADPFFTTEPRGMLVEALNSRTGLGDILFIGENESRCVASGRGHMSYPAVARINDREFVMPETASWSPPMICRLGSGGLDLDQLLELESGERVIDGTLFQHLDRVYLFGNRRELGSNALYLWSAESLGSRFSLNPASPVLVSPKGARMGGAIVKVQDRLIRFGQDGSRRYGGGLFAFEIKHLSPDAYEEQLLGHMSFANCYGPHTLNVRGEEIVFDWYREHVSAFAAVRRLKARASTLASRRRAT